MASADELLDGLAELPPLVEVHRGLVEIDFGEIEGWTAEEIAERKPEWYREWRAGRTDGFPGGDTLKGFAQQVARAWDDIVARFPLGDLLIVAHRGVVKRALMHAMGMADDEGDALDIGLASLRNRRRP